MSSSVRLHVPVPCHESWENMDPTNSGRYCAACMKDVIDFSEMSDEQIFHYFKKGNGNICGRFYVDQLNRPIQKMPERSGWLKYIGQILIPAMIFSSRSYAQGKAKMNVESIASSFLKGDTTILGENGFGNQKYPIKNSNYKVEGRIINDKGEGIPFATIKSLSTKNSSVSDEHGYFQISTNNNQVSIQISSLGCESYQASYQAPISNLVITLAREKSALTGEVIVAGTVSHVRRGINVIEKCKNLLQKLTDMDTVRIFPNPVPSGTSMQVAFDVKKAGETYLVMMSNMSGQVV
ncbi:MAG TPA: carboxypeptidase-like regulatory domain-containing protein, partial [Puia sp.]|nr:carboxypeptidase-like regulatory domain-containing protein [Puia sp.]